MKGIRRMWMAPLAVWLLAAFSWPTSIKRTPPVDAPLYAFVDARPKQEMKTGFESLLITNCAYSIMRIGGSDFDPGLELFVTDMLTARFNESLRGRQVRLVDFTVHQNGSAATRKQMTATMGGLVDSLFNKHEVHGCAPDDLRGGYLLGELDVPGASPWVLTINLDVDGKRYHARHVQAVRVIEPPPAGTRRAERQMLARQGREAQLGEAVNNLLDKLATQLAADLQSPQAPAPAPAG